MAEQIGGAPFTDICELRITCAPDSAMLVTLLDAFPTARWSPTTTIERGELIDARIGQAVGAEEGRALLMVAFHAMLLWSEVRGCEPIYDQVRSAILGKSDALSLLDMIDDGTERMAKCRCTDTGAQDRRHVFIASTTRGGEFALEFRLFLHVRDSPWWRVRIGGQRPLGFPPGGFVLAHYPEGPRFVNGRRQDGAMLVVEDGPGGLSIPGLL